MQTRSVAAVVLSLPLLAVAGCGERGPQPIRRPPVEGDLPEERTFLAQIDRTRGYRDCFEVIRDPAFAAADAAHGVAPDEIVLGLDLGATQIAYPVQLLNFHEIVEHSVGDLHLLACW